MTVAEPRFYLKNPSSLEPTLISLQAKYDGNQRVMLSTGDKILPNEWDFTIQRAKVTKKSLANGDLNIWLDRIASEFKRIFRNCLVDGIYPDAKLITLKLQENLNLLPKPKEVEKVTLLSFIESFINECMGQKATNTIKAYQGTLNHLKAYSQLCMKPFDFGDITIEWRSGFLKYLQSQGFGRNTEGKHVKNIKVFMNEANQRGLHVNLDFKSRSFTKPTEDVPKIFLTRKEIEQLFVLDLTKDKMKEVVRDYFIISCMTSLRYSDFVDIKAEHIKENTIQMVTKKTGEEVIIPIAPMVNEILKKYNFNLPPAPCNQVFNRVLKDVGKLACLDENFTVTKTLGGTKRTKTYKKYELLTCHTGRRTMISNGILAGLSPSALMPLSGHKSLKVFQSYVQLSKVQNAEALLKNQYFK